MTSSSILPITLTGNNLGKRHKQINSLVNSIYHDDTQDLKYIQNIPEKSAIDRLFKIDLASKHRDVDYIIQNLKDSDMLYVSRALKSKWILDTEYQNIMNPKNLEDNIFPFMITTAVTKVKHWLHINLRDEKRSEDFYNYYKENDFELAIKFFVKSSKNFMQNEFEKVVSKITPKYFKMLCERNSQVAKIFFDLVASDETVKSHYLNNEKSFNNGMKCLLKSDTELYLDITEKYFNHNQFSHFSAIATKFVMTCHKDRFSKKPELYTAWILDIATLAECLNVDEVKDLVVKLARAKYLRMWFDYKKVEPLIKRLKPGERAAFKKKVFVEKDVGDRVDDWPYELPASPQIEDFGPDIFEDSKNNPFEYERSTMRYMAPCYMSAKMCTETSRFCKVKTMLDKLFDTYRFVSFEKTFYELQKRILAESSFQNREFIMLVLISKTGGRPDAISTLMELLVRHKNEPPNLRAAVIRSLVKRAFIWRLPEETWKQLLVFGQGLGLDGGTPEADCIEGLHSVFIRSVIQNGTCDTAIFNAFLSNFSDLSNYSLTTEEKKCVIEVLPKMLLSACKENNNIEDAVNLIDKLIDVLKTYKIKADTYLDLIPTVVSLAVKDYSACSNLIKNLFNERIGRKSLLRYTYKLIKTDASHINALKHDISVLKFEIFYEACLENGKFDNFFRKIAIYFNEKEGLVTQFKNKLKEKKHNKFIARPLVILLEKELNTYMQELDKEETIESKVFNALLRANAHMARPGLDIDAFGWRRAGAKMIANKLLVCPTVKVQKNIQKLLEWKRTARLALVLSKRTQNETDVFVTVANLRPTIGIKIGINLLRKQGDGFDEKIWKTIKPLIQKIDFSKDATYFFYIKKVLGSIDFMPTNIKTELNFIIFSAFENEDSKSYASSPYLCRIEHTILNLRDDYIEAMLSQFLEKYFLTEKIKPNNYDDILRNCLYLRVLFTYIYLSKSEEVTKQRFENFGIKVLDRMTEMHKSPDTNKTFFKYLEELMLNLKNTKVFLNPDYVSCVFVMKKVVSWMQTILPIEQHFDKYTTVHLTMLYCKVIRKTVEKAPEVLENKKKRCKEGVKIVGDLFGKYISKEVGELMEKYFESIIYLYKDTLIYYLDKYFNYRQSSDFVTSIIKGILTEGKNEIRLALCVLEEKYYIIGEQVSNEIKSSIREVKDFKSEFFINA